MKTLYPRHNILGICASAAMLVSCAESTQPAYQPAISNQNTRSQNVSPRVAAVDASCQGQQSFKYTGHSQNFIVPMCATSVYIDAVGASGAGCCGYAGGDGGEIRASVPVKPGETLIVKVGSAGQVPQGGFNGGAAGAVIHFRSHRHKYTYSGAGGGGASDIRKGGSTLAHRVVVAGGGGGTVGQDIAGGTGGGLPDGGSGGTNGTPCRFGGPGGGGGTQSSGGSGGAGTNGGSLGDGGAGVGGCSISIPPSGFITNTSTGGGGGYYGGGGGDNGGAGGGGSGYAEPSATHVFSQNGVNSGNGSVLICWGYGNGTCGSDHRL